MNTCTNQDNALLTRPSRVKKKTVALKLRCLISAITHVVYGIATRSLEKIGSNDCPSKGIKISGLPDLFLVGVLGGRNFTPFGGFRYIHLQPK